MPRLTLFGSRFFLNIFASYAAILLVTSILVGVLVVDSTVRNLREDQETSLRNYCSLLAPIAEQALEGGEVGAFADVLRRYRADTDLRITFVRPDGTVVEDTHEQPELMDNHGTRDEIVAAGADGVGVSRRFSSTTRFDMLYVAQALRDGENLRGYVRVSRRMSFVQRELARVRKSVLVGTALGFVVAGLLGLYVARRFTVPLAAVTQQAQSLRAGRLDARVKVEKRDEIGVLADTLNQLAEEVTQRIALISQDDAQLRAMLSSMVEGVVAVDAEDRISFCNQAARVSFGLGEGPVEGKSLWDFAPIDDLRTLLSDARSGTGPNRIVLEHEIAEEEHALAVHAGPYSGGGRRGVVIVSSDITELRRLERIRRDFVANVSHELTTPPAAIKGFVETLLSGALHDDEHNERFLERIDANVNRLSELVSDLLMLARVEAQGDYVDTAEVSWFDVLGEVSRRNEEALVRKGIVLEKDVDEAHLVLGHRQSMVQILENLIDNAAKYTSEGVIQVETRVRGDRCLLRVTDTGVGIPPEDLSRVFERFYRVDKARSRDVGGTGLGLSIVKNLVLKMKGEVRVESELGVGSTFEVELPLIA